MQALDDGTNIPVYEAVYATDRSETTDVVAITGNGMLSVKVIQSSGGRKTSVFAGFDPFPETMSVDWQPDEHKYVLAQKKASDKWFGCERQPSFETQADLSAHYGLDEHMSGRVAECFEAAFGSIERPLTLAEQAARDGQKWAQAHMATEARTADMLANDATFGMF